MVQRRERAVSPNTAVDVEKSSIPNLPQGACPAQEVGGVGGETSGSARERAACGERSRTGFAPNKNSPAAKRPSPPGRGYGGSMHPCLHLLFNGTKPAQEFLSPPFPKHSSSASDDLVAAKPRYEICGCLSSPRLGASAVRILVEGDLYRYLWM
jgi:hypothetical protein